MGLSALFEFRTTFKENNGLAAGRSGELIATMSATEITQVLASTMYECMNALGRKKQRHKPLHQKPKTTKSNKMQTVIRDTIKAAAQQLTRLQPQLRVGVVRNEVRQARRERFERSDVLRVILHEAPVPPEHAALALVVPLRRCCRHGGRGELAALGPLAAAVAADVVGIVVRDAVGKRATNDASP